MQDLLTTAQDNKENVNRKSSLITLFYKEEIDMRPDLFSQVGLEQFDLLTCKRVWTESTQTGFK